MNRFVPAIPLLLAPLVVGLYVLVSVRAPRHAPPRQAPTAPPATAPAVQPAPFDLARLAAKRGLDWLAQHENTDGSRSCNVGFELKDRYEVTVPLEEQQTKGGGHVGVTALAGLAFIAGGNLPDKGDYAPAVAKTLAYVLSCVKEDGYISDNDTTLYSHALATQFLAEIFGATQREDLKEPLWDAVDRIADYQNAQGGWRYLPFAAEADLSVTATVMTALQAAARNGIDVPQRTMDRAVTWVQKTRIAAGRYRGGFKYRDRTMYQTSTSFALTAAGLAVLEGAGAADPDTTRAAIEFLDSEYATVSSPHYLSHYYFYYGNLFAVGAIRAAGGEAWDRYRPKIVSDLLKTQGADGSWCDNVGPSFATAAAARILLEALP